MNKAAQDEREGREEKDGELGIQGADCDSWGLITLGYRLTDGGQESALLKFLCFGSENAK